MKYHYQKPHPALSEFVRTVLVIEGNSSSASDDLPLVTNGLSAMFCKTRNGQVADGTSQIILGNAIAPEHWAADDCTTIIAYFFKPFMLASLFDISAAKLAKAVVDLSESKGIQTTALKTQLVFAESTTRKIEVLDNLLIQLRSLNAQVCEIIRHATDAMMYDSSTEVLQDLPEKLSINQRTFQRMFKKYVGVTASHYRRICQFQLAFSQLRLGKFEGMTDVVYENGFADQSHFIRSFREFTKTTPNQYLKSGLKDKK